MAKGSGGGGRSGRSGARGGTIGARGAKPGQILIPTGANGMRTEFAMRVTRVSGGQVFGVGATAPAGTMAAREMAAPRGQRFVRYTGTMTGDRYTDTTNLGRFGRGR